MNQDTQGFKTQQLSVGKVQQGSGNLEGPKHTRTQKKCTAACGKGATAAKPSRAATLLLPAAAEEEEEEDEGWNSQTHRVVASSRGGLASRVRVHRVDDGLPLALLVDLPEATAGLPV